MNKKSFKSNHVLTTCLGITNLFLSVFLALVVPLSIYMGGIFPTVLYFLGLDLFFIVIVLFFGNIAHFITCIFKKPVVFLDDEKIIYCNNTTPETAVYYDRICKILIDEGVVCRRLAYYEPASITLLDSNDNSLMFIENPSFFMVLNLKKRCTHARFKKTVNKYRLITFLVALIIFTLLFVVILH